MKILNKSFFFLSFLLLSAGLISCEDEKTVMGLNNTSKYGSITLTFTGIRPDNESFSKTEVFRFMPEEGPSYSSYSQDGNLYFNVQRMHGGVNESHNSNYASLYFESNEEGVVSANLDFETYMLFSDKYAMGLSLYTGIPAADVTSYSFNEETGKTKLKFTSLILAVNNSTGYDLMISGEMDVTVFKGLNGSIGD